MAGLVSRYVNRCRGGRGLWRGVSLLETVLGVVVAAILATIMFVGYQQVFSGAQQHVVLVSLKSVSRQAQASLAVSGVDSWATSVGQQAITEAVEDLVGYRGSEGIYSSLPLTRVGLEGWPSAGEVGVSFTPTSLVLMLPKPGGWCMTVTPLLGTIQGGCVEDSVASTLLPLEVLQQQLVPGISVFETPLPDSSTGTTLPP